MTRRKGLGAVWEAFVVYEVCPGQKEKWRKSVAQENEIEYKMKKKKEEEERKEKSKSKDQRFRGKNSTK